MRLIKIIFIFIAALVSHSVFAVESLTSEELASHCKNYSQNPSSNDGIFCERYIQGFVDGAMATDVAVAFNVSKLYDEDATVTQRAMRTRLGSRLKRYGSYYAEFCLDDPVELKDIVNKVTDELANTKINDDDMLARNFVFRVLRRHYPCEN